MSTARGADALAQLGVLLHGAPRAADHAVGASAGTPSVSSGTVDAVEPRPWLWEDDETGVPPLTDPAAYCLDALPPEQLHVASSRARQDPATFGTFARTSVDLTMRGGTTSGVVYPLAICEAARRFRLRNVGGASAGAIAASCAAAAEVGRTRWDLTGRAPIPPPADPAGGHVRQGFAGLADAVAWYCQLDAPDSPDQLRIAQLFQPTQPGRRLFRLFLASMLGEQRALRLATLALGVFGWRTKTLNLLIITAALVWFGVSHDDLWGAAGGGGGTVGVVGAVLAGTAWLVGLSLVVLAAAVSAVVLAGSRAPQAAGPPEPVLTEETPPRTWPWRAGLLGTLLVLPVLGGALTQEPEPGFLLEASVVWLSTLTLLAVSAALGLLRIVLVKAKAHHFGIVAGTGVSRPSFFGRLGDRIARLPHGSTAPPLVAWLDRTLRELAGQPGAVTFGDLWTPHEAVAPGTDGAADRGDRRSVNLELVTTELVHGVPQRFPYTEDVAGSWYFLGEDVWPADPSARVFPEDVAAVLMAPERRCPHPVYDVETGEVLGELFRVPPPEQLPVIVAVRMSMALPGLFQAVRLYRLLGDPPPVRDEFGRALEKDGELIAFPPPDQVWAEELWFTDGGVTQNFPIHLFDSVLPKWPTLGINLGPHPRGFRHQDVWVPDDAGSRSSPPSPLGASMAGFLGAVVNTARGWSDTQQTFMPVMRGRVAWVRQTSQEGGTNLLMSRETIAALALRGALAGQRLARRFGDDEHWRRHQWTRLRVAARNLAELRDSMHHAEVAGNYAALLDEATLLGLRDDFDRHDPSVPTEWYLPEEAGFWADTGDLIDAPPTDLEAQRGGPVPSPSLRQVPRSLSGRLTGFSRPPRPGDAVPGPGARPGRAARPRGRRRSPGSTGPARRPRRGGPSQPPPRRTRRGPRCRPPRRPQPRARRR